MSSNLSLMSMAGGTSWADVAKNSRTKEKLCSDSTCSMQHGWATVSSHLTCLSMSRSQLKRASRQATWGLSKMINCQFGTYQAGEWRWVWGLTRWKFCTIEQERLSGILPTKLKPSTKKCKKKIYQSEEVGKKWFHPASLLQVICHKIRPH